MLISKLGDDVAVMQDEEKAEGLGIYDKVPDGYFFVFPYVSHPDSIHTMNMTEAIWVYELDRNCDLVYEGLMVPLRRRVLDPKTMHVVETSKRTPKPKGFKFIARHVR